MTTFTDLALAEPLERALEASGYDTPSPIQAQAIPHLLQGRDLLGIAQTGTGKTAAFALPTLDHIVEEERDPPKRGARVLVLAPTRELVAQIADSFQKYGRFIDYLSVQRVVGGVAIGPQIKKLVGGSDILVATPGRLIDLLDRKAISLKEVEVLILDEADQMMDMGFIHALKKIVPLLGEDRQTLMFSATLPPKIVQLSKQFLTDPVRVTVSPPNSTAERVEQTMIYVEKEAKPMLLADTLLQPDVGRALVFTRTKHGADRVVKRLATAGLAAVAIHGNKSQGQRTRALDAFKSGAVNILVATDVAARGIDIPEITHVINYEIPNVAEQYVHRIGRTGRAERSGRAIAFVASDERPYLKDIHKLLDETITVEEMPADMEARIKAIRARPKIEVVRLAPEQNQRKGRGKSRKRGGGRNGERPQGRGPKGKRSGREDNAGQPRPTSKPRGKSPSKAKSDDGRMTGGAKDGYRGRVSKSSGGEKPSSARSTTRKPAPKRDGKPSAASERSAQPASKPASKPPSKLKDDSRRRRAPSRGGPKGGGQPPKRRQR